MAEDYTLTAKIASEFIGSMVLVVAAIAPMILFVEEELLNAHIGIAVLAEALTVAFILYTLIQVFGPISRAHLNPAVTLAVLIDGRMSRRLASLYIIVQFIGGFCGMHFAHLMFIQEIPVLITFSPVPRSGCRYCAEILGTFILVLAIFLLDHHEAESLPLNIGLLVGGMLMATSSTMFANPRVTFARMFTYSAAGITYIDSLIFIIIEIVSAVLAVYAYRVLTKRVQSD